MPIFPTGYDENTSPTASDKILVAKAWTNKTEYSEIWNLPFPTMQTDTFQYKTFVTVGSTNADYTTIQWAIDAATTGGTIYVTDGTYTLTSQLLFKYANTRIIGNWHSTKIQADCATVTTMIGFNANGLNNCGMENFYIANTNATTQGIGLNFSNQALGTYRNLYFHNLGTALRADDTVDQTFYNKFEDIKIYECNNGLDFTSTNPFNDNAFDNVRVALKTGGTGNGLYMNNAQGNTFHNCNFEPSSGNTGIHLDTNLVINTSFFDVYIEGNTLGVSITSSQRTTFYGGMIVANTTNITDTGLSTQYIGTNVNYALKNETVNLGIIDKWNASSLAADIKNNTTYAHTGGTLARVELLNGSDTSKVLEVKNAGSGNSLSVMQGASEVASVSSAGKFTTLSTIELWHASDTTLSRVSAWVAAIEGNNIVVNTSSPTLATITTTWNIELGNASDTTISRVSAGKVAVEWVNVGTEWILQNSQSAAYTTVLTDAWKHIYHPSADTTARTWTIDSNANVAYPVGTAITFINDTSAWVITIAITTDTMILAWAGTTWSRTLAANGIATAVKMTSTRWIISWTWLT